MNMFYRSGHINFVIKAQLNRILGELKIIDHPNKTLIPDTLSIVCLGKVYCAEKGGTLQSPSFPIRFHMIPL